MRISIDTGGTFTDLVLETEDSGLRIFKSPTTPADPLIGILNALELAAVDLGVERRHLLQQTDVFVHATTRPINAILTGSCAPTALVTTAGHRDILLYREGGRTHPFNFARDYPDPYVPRALTFEAQERIDADGRILTPLSEIEGLAEAVVASGVTSVAVCLLWSIVNPVHELMIGDAIRAIDPSLEITLSHELTSAPREYRRASATAIDASLKPVMTPYLSQLSARLAAEGFAGRALIMTSAGGVLDVSAVADAPIHSLGSGPAGAPVAGKRYAALEADASTVIVTDSGGTSYDVSVVRNGHIPITNETWLGERYAGHITGFPAVDVTSIGAGGGSIAWVDNGGLLHVGPQSAGSEPGPVCYARGGTDPTVSDAALTVGYLDPEYFLGGRMQLDVEGARAAIADRIAKPLGLSTEEAASAVLELATEHMATAIEEITLEQGIDPRSAVVVAGGGSGGLLACAIARRIRAATVVIPDVAAALSAAGIGLSELVSDFSETSYQTTRSFDHGRATDVLDRLTKRCEDFLSRAGANAIESTVGYSVDARYPSQVWEINVPLPAAEMSTDRDVADLETSFHAAHLDLFAVADPDAPVEVITWKARASAQLRRGRPPTVTQRTDDRLVASRSVHFAGSGPRQATVLGIDHLPDGQAIPGPTIVETPVTTVVIPPYASVTRTAGGSLLLFPDTRTADVPHA